MTSLRRATSLFFGLLLTAAAHAQTPLGKPTLDEQKVQIWCATVKFVYNDNHRPNLKSKLNCGGTLKQFETSIKPDSQKVYSLLYQPLEGRGTMYKGLGTDQARSEKLVTEIINRLKASTARKASPARMQAVEALNTSLRGYVENGTPPGDIGANDVASAEFTDTTTSTDEATASASPDAGPATIGDAATTRSSGESFMSKFFSPLALILSLLSLVLYALLRGQIGKLVEKVDRYGRETKGVRGNTSDFAASSPASTNKLTPELQREVEKLVQQRVAEELRKQAAPASVAAPQPVTPAPVAATPGPKPIVPAPVAPAPIAAPPTSPAPAAPLVADPPVAPAPAPVTYEAPASMSETSPVPPVIPAGSPASAPTEEFDSLVPPVQFPVSENQVTEEAGDALATDYTRYVKVPVNGGFNIYDLSEEPQHDSIYEIILDTQFPEVGIFQVNPDPAVHAYAIQSAQYSLREACRYEQPTGPVSRIVTDEEGTLRKVGGVWQIESKALIHFE
ncbi:hypothetical protein [Hymenobacter crusticola]|uniref:Uncharacterized protein n=1 Tax=Hymenobacter crusticola TaxID=1770526 RepID=A0A243WDQ7_9BACT|nr:hypothetical protein [Hymenobacter crusticola]OUJ73795.1 hypothetical protein BXP70_12520 [Hymenobacter crusticola]